MYNTVLIAVLLLLSLLPNFNHKAELEAKLKNKIVSVNTVAQNQKAVEVKTIPQKASSFEQISVGSSAALFVDMENGEILFEKNKGKRLAMASTTKLMTALIAVEHFKSDDIITVKTMNTQPLDSVMGLASGDKLKFSELLHGLLIDSGADAADVIAQTVSGDENHFAALMNERASKLGLANTQFTNSIGQDDNGHYSTAADLLKLARVALSNTQIASIVSKKNYTAQATSGKTYYLVNTNKLLWDQNYKGVKTGTTFAAGECLVSLYDDGTHKVLGVVLNSRSRFAETDNIMNWTKQAFLW